MTGTVFVLFTFYMMADPGTTPVPRRSQVVFGASVALVYGLLQVAHVVFGLFFSLAMVCMARGTYLALASRRPSIDVEVPLPVAERPAPRPKVASTTADG
jgi:hypothetical protein